MLGDKAIRGREADRWELTLGLLRGYLGVTQRPTAAENCNLYCKLCGLNFPFAAVEIEN